jgi:hypothetical protein
MHGRMKVAMVLAGLAFSLALMPVSTRASDSHAATHKTVCKTVTKKVHGKKKRVRVCHTVKAAPKPTATRTPRPTSTPVPPPTNTPTPLPTNTPVPTNTPQPTSTPVRSGVMFQILTPPAPSPSFAYQAYHMGTFDGVIYTAGSLSAIAGLDCGGVQCGYEESVNGPYGSFAPDGFMYVWVFVTEGAGPNASSFYSSFLNFQLRGSNGAVYGPSPVAPPETHLQLVMGGAQLVAGDVNPGWIRFTVPRQPGQYDLRWTATPFLQVVSSFAIS